MSWWRRGSWGRRCTWRLALPRKGGGHDATGELLERIRKEAAGQ
jgi:hypothetical protein